MSFLCKKRVISQTLLEIITFLSIGSIPLPITYYLFNVLFIYNWSIFNHFANLFLSSFRLYLLWIEFDDQFHNT